MTRPEIGVRDIQEMRPQNKADIVVMKCDKGMLGGLFLITKKELVCFRKNLSGKNMRVRLRFLKEASGEY